jgi:TM2 domain-containing membrane protein YozV
MEECPYGGDAMKQLQNSNINPIVPLLLNVFVLPGLGDMMLGQNQKGIMVILCSLVGICLCCVPGAAVIILSHIDVYMCAAALQRGETIGENEYRQELLYKIVKVIDKSATYRG